MFLLDDMLYLVTCYEGAECLIGVFRPSVRIKATWDGLRIHHSVATVLQDAFERGRCLCDAFQGLSPEVAREYVLDERDSMSAPFAGREVNAIKSATHLWLM